MLSLVDIAMDDISQVYGLDT